MLSPRNDALHPWRSRLSLSLLFACVACGGGGGDTTPTTPPPVVIVPPATAPSLSIQPQNASAIDGAKASFSVVATGTAPLSYQWQLDGKNIDGATQASYSTAALRLTDSGGQYRVVISNAGGSLTSNAAVLTVQPIAITVGAQPKSASVADGAAATFSVEAGGSGPIDYQWMRGGSSIAGATGASYTTPALGLADSKSEFQVMITNPAGTVASDKVVLTVTPVAPTITSQPASLTVADHGTVNLTVGAAGSAPQSYQWKRNGSAIAGATSASYSFSADFPNSGDKYSVTISNMAGTVDSQAAIVTVNPLAASFSTLPQALTINPGGSASFSAVASGTAPLSYQWQRSMDGGKTWVTVAGATDTSYKLNYATLADTAASFRVQVSNPAATVSSQAAELTVAPHLRIIAGALGGRGFADGRGAQARFDYLTGLTADRQGNLYVADSGNQVVRRIAPDGQTSVFAGKPGAYGEVNGSLSEARFTSLADLALDSRGNLLVATSCAIRKISTEGIVSTIAGDPNACGAPADGQGSAAHFSYIRGIVIDSADNLYLTDASNSQTVRKVTPDGRVSTLAGSFGQLGTADGIGSAARFTSLAGLALDATGNLLVIDGNLIRRVTRQGEVNLFAGTTAIFGPAEGDRLTVRLNTPSSLAFDADGNLFITEWQRISRMDRSGMVLTAAGRNFYTGDLPDSQDGQGSTAAIYGGGDIALLPNGNMAFLETASYTVRTISPNATVSTLAGLGPQTGKRDGATGASRFRSPAGLVVDASGAIYLADRDNARIRRVGSDGLTSTVAGGEWGAVDGAPDQARFAGPAAVARDTAGYLYIADSANHAIRKISPTGATTTLAGKLGESGNVNGTGATARFNYPRGIAVDANGNVLVADAGNQTIRKITPGGLVSTLAGAPHNGSVRDGPGIDARFGFPESLAIDSKGYAYVTDSHLQSIRRIAPDGTVSTFAGEPYSPAYADGVVPFVRLKGPVALAFDKQDNLFVADAGNKLIRRISPDGRSATVAGVPGLAVTRPGVGGSLNEIAGLAVLPNGRLVIVSEQALLSD